jgi:hypothetical protein
VSRFCLQPVVALRLDTAARGGLTGTGAGAPSLRVQDGNVTSLRGTVGLRADSTFELGTGYSLSPALLVRWSHELDDAGVRTTSAFADNPNVRFGQASARSGRDGVDVSVRLNLQMPSGVSILASYAAESCGNVSGRADSGGLRYAWQVRLVSAAIGPSGERRPALCVTRVGHPGGDACLGHGAPMLWQPGEAELQIRAAKAAASRRRARRLADSLLVGTGQ